MEPPNMSEVIERAVSELNAKLGDGFDGSAKFIIEDEGTIVIDDAGARAGDTPTDVTLTADADTFRQLLGGDLDPMAAFMQGRLKVDGDMSAAMKLSSALG
jgi:putative sterol carrier protein